MNWNRTEFLQLSHNGKVSVQQNQRDRKSAQKDSYKDILIQTHDNKNTVTARTRFEHKYYIAMKSSTSQSNIMSNSVD